MKCEHTDKWLVTVTVQPVPIDRHGEQSGRDGLLNYAINISGDLAGVIKRLEMLRDPDGAE